MKILDRYLSKYFFPSYLWASFTFLFFYLLVDFLTHVGEFTKNQAQIGEVFTYYLYSALPLWIKLSPLAVLMGVWFSIGQLTQHNEILSIRLCGISILRVIQPLIIWGLLISFLGLGFNLRLIPFSKQKQEETWQGKIQGQSEYLHKVRRNLAFPNPEGDIFYVREFNGKEGTIQGISLIRKSEQGRLVREMVAQEALWQEGKWILRDGVVREFAEDGKLKKTLQFKEKEIELLPPPADLWLYQRDPSLQTMDKIKSYLQQARQTGSKSNSYLTEYHSRYSLPFINLTLLILSIPFCLLSLQQNIVGRMGWALGFSLIYYVLFSLMVALARKGTISPPVAVWLPNLVFLSLGLFYLWKKR